MTSELPPDLPTVAGPATPPYPWPAVLYPQQPALPPLAAAGRPRRGLTFVLATVGVLAALVGAAVAVVVVRLGDRPMTVGMAAAATPVAASTSALPSPTPSLALATVDTVAAQRAFLLQVEVILQQSAQARAQVTNLVAGVTNGCAVAPGPASEAIGQIIANRRSVLGQAAALDVSSVPSAADIRGALVNALTESIDADNEYEQWLDYLYSRYFNAFPVGCPFGAVPIDDHYRAAASASANADAAKRAFVAAFDPLAVQAGLRAWSDTDF